MKTRQKPTLQQILFYAVAVSVLLAVFALYDRPDFLFILANQVWGCF